VPEFTCRTCAATFSLSDTVLDRYPGWTPKTCRSCREGGGGRGGVRRVGGPARRARIIEENLTVAEVLERYTGGPQDGVFTDGSATPNPGPGGWGAVYVAGGRVVDQAHGHEAHTTNNRMELTALLAGFDLVPDGTAATIYTDSRLAVDTITTWAPAWERNGWRRKTGPIQNLELVQALYAKAQARPELRLEWIRAHAGNRWNEYADSLSTAYLREQL
jgi:ribonuclease HI